MAGATTTIVTHTLNLQPGESFTLPAGAELVYVSDSPSITTDCVEVPDAEYKCGVFYFNIDEDNNDNHPLDEDSTKVANVKVGDVTYTIDQLAASATVTNLNANITATGLFSFTYVNIFTINDSGDDKRKAVYLYFQVVDDYYDDLLLGVTSHTIGGFTRPTTQYYKPHDEVTCGEYTEY